MRKYGKPYRLKRKKSILRNRFFWFGILALFIIGTAAYILFFSWIFQIKNVKITGENKVSREEIESFFSVQNIFLTDIKKIRKDILDSFPRIAEAEIYRSLPATLNVIVVERVTVAIWCKDEDECFPIDQGGVVFKEAYADSVWSEDTELVSIFGEKELLEEKIIRQILEIKLKIKKDSDIEITKAVPVSSKRLNIKTAEGWEIYFNPEGDLDWQLTQLRLVLERQISSEERQRLEYIDLRFSKVYYK